MDIDVDDDASYRFVCGAHIAARGESQVVISSSGGRPTTAAVGFLVDAMETSEKLTNLHVSGVYFDDAAATDLARGLARCASLFISGCEFTDAGFAALVAGVAGSKTLKKLLFSNMELASPAVAALADGVAHSTTLESLNLCGCGIDDAGALELAAAVAKSHTLVELRLRFNQLTDVGAVAIATEIANRRSRFAVLTLNGNSISDEGWKDIVRQVARSRYLWELVGYFGASSITTLIPAYSLSGVANATFALLGRSLVGIAPGKMSAAAFLEADGDHAVWRRVMVFLLRCR